MSEEEKSLQQLRKIFFADKDEKQEQFEKELADLKIRTSDKEAKIQAYYPIITDLLERKIIDSEDELAKVLSPLMGKALKKQISESKDDIIDALYPIMGETIKKTVAESIKEVYNTLNQKIDKALRRGVFSKQVKSKISGVSANDLILREAFPFTVKEIFLIHEESGLLISHVSANDINTADVDLISGMLTAIKDFVRESFKTESGSQNLYEIQYGDSRIMLERGRYSYLAIVVGGQEPAAFDNKLSELNNGLHEEYSKKLREFDGNVEELKDIEIPLRKFINQFENQPAKVETQKPKPVLGYLLLGILGIIILIWGIIKIPQYFEEKSLNDKIAIELEKLNLVNSDNISWEIADDEIKLLGYAKSFVQKEKVDSSIKSVLGNKKLNNQLSVLFLSSNSDAIIKSIDSTLITNNYSQVSYTLVQDKVILDGSVKSENEKIILSDKISRIDGVRIIINNLEIKDDLLSVEYIESIELKFDYRSIDLNETNSNKLEEIIATLKSLKNNIKIIGISDGNVSESNLRTAKDRAESVKLYFIGKGIPENKLIIESMVDNNRLVKFDILGIE